MRAKYINPFLNSVVKVLKSNSPDKIKTAKPSLRDGIKAYSPYRSISHISGERNGYILISVELSSLVDLNFPRHRGPEKAIPHLYELVHKEIVKAIEQSDLSLSIEEPQVLDDIEDTSYLIQDTNVVVFPIITKHGSIFLEISLEDEALDEEKDPNSGGLIGNISKLSINTIAFASNSFAYISTEKWEALKKYWKDDEEKALEKIKKFRDEKGSKVAFNAPHISSLRFADDEKTGSVTVSTPWERETKKEGVLFDITLGIEASNELEFKDFNIATIAIPEEVKKEPKKKEKKEEKPAKEESTEEPTEEAPSD